MALTESAFSGGPPDSALLYAPHGRPGRFWNPWGSFPNRLVDVLRWKLLSRNPYGRRGPLAVPRVDNDGAYLARRGEPPSLTWVGHSTFAIQDGGGVALTDPHWGPRALVVPRLTAPGVPLAAVPEDAFAVLSHNHYDHLDAWTARRLPAGVRWYVPWGVGRWFRRRLGAAAAANVVELDWWESARHGAWTLTCLPAQHWSNRLSERRHASLWASWLLDSGARRYYFAGDTGWFHGFAELGRRFAPIDVALLPIGAYEPRWFMRYQHLDPAEAWRAFGDLGARRLVAMHWGVFDLTDEPPDLAPRALSEALAAADGDPARVVVPAIGERWL
ncbi:MAG TPA: MBL fold metallo-hydrolase, partial [Thermoanaerobaculia bacterium]|nr:MBL fold metallo-hydrolase [Thermoanaerobaculia bacterium]